MLRRPPRSTRTDTLFPYTTLFRSLSVWKRLPNESRRVYRLQTDDGERINGRRVSPAWAANAASTGTSNLTSNEAYAALVDGRTILNLADGLQLRRARVMGANRVELSRSEARRVGKECVRTFRSRWSQ